MDSIDVGFEMVEERDFSVLFTNGEVQVFVLRAGDRLDQDCEKFSVRYANGSVVDIYAKFVMLTRLMTVTRKRRASVPVDDTPPRHTDAPPPTSPVA